MTGATEGRAGVRSFLRRFVLWRVGLGWYLFVLVGVPALFVLSIIVLPGVLGSFQGLGALAPPLSFSVGLVTHFSQEERWAKSLAGAGLRCPGCRRCMVFFSGA